MLIRYCFLDGKLWLQIECRFGCIFARLNACLVERQKLTYQKLSKPNLEENEKKMKKPELNRTELLF